MHTVDLHCDTLYKHITENKLLNDSSHEVLIENGDNRHHLQCYAIWLPDSYTGAQAEQTVIQAARQLQAECSRLDICLLRQQEDVRQAFAQHPHTAFFTIENGLALNGKIDNVARFAALGVRMMTLTWNAHNAIGDGADVTHAQGLTDFGKKVLREMERNGIIIDISHASEALFYDVAAQTELPIVASHSNAYAVTPHRRNLKDEQIEVLIRRAGLFGLNFHNAFLNERPGRASVTDILRHTEHFLSRGGENCLCFGSDFDGGVLPHDIQNSRVYDMLYELFLQHHYPETLIQKIFYDNALKFFENFDKKQRMMYNK